MIVVAATAQSKVMKNGPRILMFLAGVSLLMLFVFPMWQITLVAPQYPTGVTMYIWINKIGGTSPGTLQNINILNHYVGMKMIEPSSIPELEYFQYVVIAMAALGVLFAVFNKRITYLLWTALLVVLGALGIYDFYLWEYDYGHTLSPHAPIKIPGMSYQPPLLGSKTLLNFVADSWPYIGGWFVGLAILLGFVAFWWKRKIDQHNENQHRNSRRVLARGRRMFTGA